MDPKQQPPVEPPSPPPAPASTMQDVKPVAPMRADLVGAVEAETAAMAQAGATHGVMINLLPDNLKQRGEATIAAAAAAVPVVTEEPKKEETGKKRSKLVPIALGAVLLLAVLGAGGYVLASQMNKPQPVAVATPKPSATPSSSPTPFPTPTPSATPAPTPVPSNETVTAPKVAPTAEHPQTVTVTSKSGVWLRSSPSSANQKNVIGWIPNGGQVSVDATGDFWWHGTYNGKTGYFAVKYTN